MSDSPRLLVFAKAPLPNTAKTRLIPALGARGAAALAEKMLHHTLRECTAAAIGPVELCVAPDRDHPYWRECTLPADIEVSDQGEGDLGQRLWRAAARTTTTGEPVLLLGTDCPQLTAARLRAAAAALQEADAVMHPARDGGYTLLGLNRVESALFEGIAWSTAAVARQTRERLVQCGMRSIQLETLTDIDEPEDLEALPADWGFAG
ncbi:TIGR04282 family arsenosugar biosynthesis glycosyltransferase [Microbulbifer hainanensis]|uniref:TIGR04282 family arsenosugar biosynthesis glycosyltransferase n=1 Tax=Microbulbifer hainanensis TaxID=2735675 RepID=UPI0018670B1A|nr:TIGR04282 family arsenosugar biosynthesis glycosyltransferase [Microbulbifer hainanensis]